MNMKFAATTLVGLVSLVALAPTAAAADNGFYLGGGATSTNFHATVDGIKGSDDGTGFKVIAGIRPLDWIAVEANYLDMGNVEKNGLKIDSTALTVSGLLIANISIVDLYARVGAAKWDAKFSVTGVGNVSDDGWEPTYGAGVGVHFGSFGLRAEYEMFTAKALNDQVKTDLGTVSISFLYTFL